MGTDILIARNNLGTVVDVTFTGSGNYPSDATNDATSTYDNAGGFVITRPLDTGDETDFVIPKGTEWTLGWAVCKTSTDYENTPPDNMGSWTVFFEGASYLAGLTATSLAAMALMLSH